MRAVHKRQPLSALKPDFPKYGYRVVGRRHEVAAVTDGAERRNKRQIPFLVKHFAKAPQNFRPYGRVAPRQDKKSDKYGGADLVVAQIFAAAAVQSENKILLFFAVLIGGPNFQRKKDDVARTFAMAFPER